jgi:hypothetical protein
LFYNSYMYINVASIGSIAWRIWQRDQTARVMGVTSRGLFLSIEHRILFVSFERWRGPLTINLDRTVDQLRTLDVGAVAIFSNNRLTFPTTKIILLASPNAVWHAPSPVIPPCPIDQQRNTAQQIAAIVTTRALDRGFAPLLNPLLDLPLDGPLSGEQSAVFTILQLLRHALRDNDLAPIPNFTTQLLGRGSGLTPSGDDCVLGFLLMLNRWQTDENWRELNRAVIDAAYHKTTTISANLFECAATGQADERLLNVVDGIATSSGAIDECVECVLGWGSSSGIDALVGMIVAM